MDIQKLNGIFAMEVKTNKCADEKIQRKKNDDKSIQVNDQNIYFTNNCRVVVEKFDKYVQLKKKRGRPKKIVNKNDKTSVDSNIGNENILNNQSIVLKRCRGRPKKNKITSDTTEISKIISNTPKNQKQTITMVTKTNENESISKSFSNLEISKLDLNVNTNLPISEEFNSIDKNVMASNESVLNDNNCMINDIPQNLRYLKCVTLERLDKFKNISNTKTNAETETSGNDDNDDFIGFDQMHWDMPSRTRSQSLDKYTKLQHRRNSLSDNFVYNFNKFKKNTEGITLHKLWKSLSYLEGGPNINFERYQSHELNKKIRTNLKRSRSFPNCMLLDTVTWRFLANQQSCADENYDMLMDYENYGALTDYEINLINEMPDIPNRNYRSKSLPINLYKKENKNYINKSIGNLNKLCYSNNLPLKSFRTDVYNVIDIKNCTKQSKNNIRRSKRLNSKVKCTDHLEEECFVQSNELKMQYLLLASQIQHETEQQLLEARENDPELDKKLKKLNFTLITSNLFRPERKNIGFYNQGELQDFRKLKYRFINTDAYICNCKYSKTDWKEGKPACGSDCLNRSLNIECGPYCPLEKICTNRQFQNKQFKRIKIDKTPYKGYGVFALENIPSNTFINEYIGEVINQHEMMKRMESQLYKNNNYMVQLKYDEIIDATCKGNISRFINHSCDPNCTAEKWSVLGESRMGFISNRLIQIGEEITFDYSFETFGAESQKCFCGTSKCRGFINRKSKTGDQSSDENEYIDLGEKKNTTLYLKELDRHLKEICLFKNINKSDLENSTLNLNKFMVHITDSLSQSHILKFIRNNDLNCKKLFMNFNGLSIIQSWMVNCNGNESIKLDIVQTLSELPILDRNTITKSKVLDVVTEWADIPIDIKKDVYKLEYPIAKFKDHKIKIDKLLPDENISPLVNAARKLWKKWISLKMIFKIPKLIRPKDVNVVKESITSTELKHCVQNQVTSEHLKTNSTKVINYSNQSNKNKTFLEWNKYQNRRDNIVVKEQNKLKSGLILKNQQDIPTIETTSLKKNKWNHISEFTPAVYEIPTESNTELMEYYSIQEIITSNKSRSSQIPWLHLMTPENTYYEAQYPSFKDQVAYMSTLVKNNNTNLISMTSDTISNKKDFDDNIVSQIIPVNIKKNLLKRSSDNLQKLCSTNLLINKSIKNYIDRTPMKISQSFFKKKLSISYLKHKSENFDILHLNNSFKCLKIASNFYQKQPSKIIEFNDYKLKLLDQNYKNDVFRIKEYNEISKINVPSLALKLCNEQLNTVPQNLNIKKSLDNQFFKMNSENKFMPKIINGLRKKNYSNNFVFKQPLNNTIITLNPIQELELHQKLIPTVTNMMCLKYKSKNNSKEIPVFKQKLTMHYNEQSKLPKSINKLRSDNSAKDKKVCKRKLTSSSNIKYKKKRKIDKSINTEKSEINADMINLEELTIYDSNQNTCITENIIVDNKITQKESNKTTPSHTQTEANGNKSLHRKTSNISMSKSKMKPFMKCLPFNKVDNISDIELEQNTNNSDICLTMNHSDNNSVMIDSIVDNYNISISNKKNTVRSNFADDPIVKDYIQRTKLKTLESKYQFELPESMKSLPVEVLNLLPDSQREINIVINFYHSMATVIVKMLDPYVKKSCLRGRIKNKEDFKFLARKLNSNILFKELQVKNIENLRLSESVKSKVGNYIKKYMLKFGKHYRTKNTD